MQIQKQRIERKIMLSNDLAIQIQRPHIKRCKNLQPNRRNRCNQGRTKTVTNNHGNPNSKPEQWLQLKGRYPTNLHDPIENYHWYNKYKSDTYKQQTKQPKLSVN